MLTGCVCAPQEGPEPSFTLKSLQSGSQPIAGAGAVDVPETSMEGDPGAHRPRFRGLEGGPAGRPPADRSPVEEGVGGGVLVEPGCLVGGRVGPGYVVGGLVIDAGRELQGVGARSAPPPIRKPDSGRTPVATFAPIAPFRCSSIECTAMLDEGIEITGHVVHRDHGRVHVHAFAAILDSVTTRADMFIAIVDGVTTIRVRHDPRRSHDEVPTRSPWSVHPRHSAETRRTACGMRPPSSVQQRGADLGVTQRARDGVAQPNAIELHLTLRIRNVADDTCYLWLQRRLRSS
jgi:hypothetical protein